MATPSPITNDSTRLLAEGLNVFLNAIKAQVKINFFRLTITIPGPTPSIASTSNDGEVVTGDLSWSGTLVDVVLTGFTAIPIVFCNISSPHTATNILAVRGRATSTTAAEIACFDNAKAIATPNATMSIEVFVIGV